VIENVTDTINFGQSGFYPVIVKTCGALAHRGKKSEKFSRRRFFTSVGRSPQGKLFAPVTILRASGIEFADRKNPRRKRPAEWKFFPSVLARGLRNKKAEA
jgi:hypothetical protein